MIIGIYHSVFEYLNDKVRLLSPLKSMVISILLNIGMVKFLQILHSVLIVQRVIFQIKIFNKINFFLIIIYIFLQFKMFIDSPYNLIWTTDIQNALLFVSRPGSCIAIDHSSVGLKRVTIQLMVNEA